uniref:cytochrome P460 family protein n=1 Tax=uncultured Meiothermus sp. TaxID=157471 RepID=UPI00260A0F32
MKKWMLLVGLLAAGVVLAQVASLAENIRGYAGWTRVNVSKINTAGAHPLGKDVYVNLTPERLLAAGGGYSLPFAPGTIFVKERTDPTSLVVTHIWVMQKRSSTAGDWAWAAYERKGDTYQGGVLASPAMCVDCHQRAN